MKTTTLSFFVKEGKVLLAIKKRGFGMGKWNGVGGKVNESEDIKAAAVREIMEEVDIEVLPEHLQAVGTLKFSYESKPDWDQVCHLFMVQEWNGEAKESEEMRPKWYPVDQLPFGSMWVDDPHWLPKVLAGNSVDGEFSFDATGGAMKDFNVKVRL